MMEEDRLYYILIGCIILVGGFTLGYNTPEPVPDDAVVVGTPSYNIKNFMISFKEPSAYGEDFADVKKDGLGYTTMDNYIVIKSYQDLDTVDQTCVHEVAHNLNPDRNHPEDSSSPWYERQERLTSREVCEILKQKLLQDSDQYLRTQ